MEVKTDKVKGFDGRLIPKSIIAAQYFAEEQKALQVHTGELEVVTAQIDEMIEDDQMNVIFRDDCKE